MSLDDADAQDLMTNCARTPYQSITSLVSLDRSKNPNAQSTPRCFPLQIQLCSDPYLRRRKWRLLSLRHFAAIAASCLKAVQGVNNAIASLIQTLQLQSLYTLCSVKTTRNPIQE